MFNRLQFCSSLSCHNTLLAPIIIRYSICSDFEKSSIHLPTFPNQISPLDFQPVTYPSLRHALKAGTEPASSTPLSVAGSVPANSTYTQKFPRLLPPSFTHPVLKTFFLFRLSQTVLENNLSCKHGFPYRTTDLPYPRHHSYRRQRVGEIIPLHRLPSQRLPAAVSPTHKAPPVFLPSLVSPFSYAHPHPCRRPRPPRHVQPR